MAPNPNAKKYINLSRQKGKELVYSPKTKKWANEPQPRSTNRAKKAR
jgi:hypothetical protein